MAFRPYTTQEVRDAAQAYGVDPDFAEAIYAAESSRGTNPQAMTARSVKTKGGTAIIRGPFQVNDDTAADVIRKNKLGNVNVDDPDVHLDIAMRIMKDLQDRYHGDFGKMAQAYLGGPGSVGTNARDENGTSVGGYANNVLNEMSNLRSLIPATATRSPAPADDMFGIPAGLPPMLGNGGPAGRGSWSDLVAANRPQSAPGSEFALPQLFAGADLMQPNQDADLTAYLQELVNDELKGKEFANAA